MDDDLSQVSGFATVVKAQVPVHLTTAGAIVPGQGIPTKPIGRPGHACHIGTSAMPFQAMGNHHQTARATTAPVQVQEVPIGGGDPLPFKMLGSNLTPQARIDRKSVV